MKNLLLSTLGLFLLFAQTSCDRNNQDDTDLSFEKVLESSGSEDFATAVLPLESGGAVVTGQYGGQVLFLNLNDKGEVLSQKYISAGVGNDAYGSGIVAVSDGYLICGGASNAANGQDALLLKVDFSGNVLWQKFYGGAEDEYLENLCLSPSGDIWTVGSTTSGAGNYDFLLLHTDSNGNELNIRNFGGFSTDLGNDIMADGSNGFWIYGGTYSYGAGDRDLCLYHLDANGDSTKFYTYGSPNYEESQGFTKNNAGELILSAHSMKTDMEHNFYGLKINPSDGAVIWEKEYGDNGTHEGGEGVTYCADNDKIYFIGRYHNHTTNAESAFALQIDNNGSSILGLKPFQSGNFHGAKGYAIAAKGKNIWAVGKVRQTNTSGFDTWIKKVKTDEF